MERRGAAGCLRPAFTLAITVTLFSCATAAKEFREPTDSNTGLRQPLSLCSKERPCRHQKGHSIANAVDKPRCAATAWHRKRLDDGAPYMWHDSDNTPRYACIYRPAGASPQSPRPLLLWLHGGEGSAEDLYNHTSLRPKAESFDLSGNDRARGFVLVSIQGRNIHYPTGNPPGSREGRHHDIYYRDLGANSRNPDIQFLDHLVDSLVKQGVVDRRRIYTMGWSNGGYMAQLYGMARYRQATPGGNHVASASAFGSAEPFHDVVRGQGGRLKDYPKAKLPLFLIQRSCDAASACSAAQNEVFKTPPGYALIPWLETLRSRVGNTMVEYRIIDDAGRRVHACDDSDRCLSRSGFRRGLRNHVLWPDGIEDRGGHDWEVEALNFFRAHPHPASD